MGGATSPVSLQGSFSKRNMAHIVSLLDSADALKLTSLDRFPLLVTMILIAIGAVGFICVRMLLLWENRRRARIVETWTAQEFEQENENGDRRGDMKLTFRYGY